MSTIRVGGPPRGPPPGGVQKPGGAPKGAPPGGKKGKPGAPKGKAPPGGAANANIPKAPAASQFICFIKGEPFTGAPGGDAAGGDDLDLDAAADIANMSAILDGLDGDNPPPFKVDEPSSAEAP